MLLPLALEPEEADMAVGLGGTGGTAVLMVLTPGGKGRLSSALAWALFATLVRSIAPGRGGR